MSRRCRPHLAGGTFHLTARLHGREPLFTPRLRTAIVGLIREEVAVRDLDLFAYAVMPNHLHLVVRQQRAPLAEFMQPLIRRIALLVQRSHGREGHVFERRYRDRPCGTADHLRHAIVYTHLNPERAGLCAAPEEHPWTSRARWVRGASAADGARDPSSPEKCWQVFASGEGLSPSQLIEEYLQFEGRRRARDGSQAAPGEVPIPPARARALTRWGDLYWEEFLSPDSGQSLEGRGADHLAGLSQPDLATIAQAVMNDLGPGILFSQVRSRWGGPAYVDARRRIIRRAAIAGYKNHQIATYLRISRSTVSAVLTAARKELLSSDH